MQQTELVAPRVVNAVSDMSLDEVSLVDRPANPHASIVIAKSLGADMTAPIESETGYYWPDGTPVAADDEIGPEDQVLDAEGNIYELDAEAIQELEDEANQGELAEVGKSSAFGRTAPRGQVQKSLAEELSEQLKSMVSKSAGGVDEGTRAVLSKAVEALQASEARTAAAEQIAKSERDIRLTREYISKADSYGDIPGVTAQELGPILKRCEELLPSADCVVLNKVFEATGGILFKELGRTGGGSNDLDPFAIVEAQLESGQIAKSADGKPISKAAATTEYFTQNPEAYDEYVASRQA